MPANRADQCGDAGPVQAAWSAACNDLGNRWQNFSRGCDQNLRLVQQQCIGAVTRLSQVPGQHLERLKLQHQQQQQHLLPGLASITAAFGRPPRAQPVADVAFNPMDIAARLAGIPVYTVANKKNEFVLVSGQGDEEPKQLGLFFFSAKDAQALIDKIKEQNPKLAKQSQVLAVSLDKVYGFAITKGEADNLKNVVFRFMPDAKQVQNAMQLYQEAGVAVPGFTGVPVFQAEGLTVKTERARYTPLFFSKDDLDEAIGNAVSQRDSQRLETTKLKASRAESDLNIAQATLQESKGRGERKAAQADVSKASARLEKYVKRIDELSIKTSKPKVEVGCLEEVISKMELDDDNGDWGTVMFVPPGTITGLPDGGSSELKAAGK